MSERRIAGFCLALIIGALSGCAGTGDKRPDQVEIVAQTPSRPFRVITEVKYGSPDLALMNNQASLDALRAMAAKSGADAIIGVTRDTTMDGTLVASDAFGTEEWAKPKPIAIAPTKDQKAAHISVADFLRALSIVYRAQAIKYE